MTIAARLDDIGKPAWIALMIAGFVVWWPIGLVTLGFLIGSGRIMGCWTHRRHDRWQRRMQEGMERMQQAASGWGPWGSARGSGWCGPGRQSSSGNAAFDEYRSEAPVAVHGDEPARAAGLRQSLDDLARRRVERLAAVPHPGGDLEGRAKTHKDFAVAGR